MTFRGEQGWLKALAKAGVWRSEVSIQSCSRNDTITNLRQCLYIRGILLYGPVNEFTFLTTVKGQVSLTK